MEKAIFFGLLAVLILVLSWQDASDAIASSFFTILNIDIKPLVSKLRGELTGFYALFLATLYLDVVKQRNSIKLLSNDIDKAAKFIETLKTNVDKRQFLDAYMADVYKDTNIKTLTANFLPNKPAFRDVNVYLRIREDDTDKEFFFYDQSIEFEIQKEFLIVAVTNLVEVQDALFNDPHIDDVFCDSGFNAQDQECVVNFLSRSKFSQIVTDDSDKVRSIDIGARNLSKKDTKAISDKLPQHMRSSVAFLRIEKSISSEVSAFKINYPKTRFQKNLPFVYWKSDRVLYLKKITIEGEHFCSSSLQKITIMPFIPSYTAPMKISRIDKSDFPIELRIESWLCYGQGVIISWR
jgi:hypothetical protein